MSTSYTESIGSTNAMNAMHEEHARNYVNNDHHYVTPEELAQLRVTGGYKTEFHRLAHDFWNGDLQDFPRKYPLSSTIYLVASVILGFSYLFSLSPFNIVIGIFFLATGTSLAWHIITDDITAFIPAVIASFKTVKAATAKAKETTTV